MLDLRQPYGRVTLDQCKATSSKGGVYGYQGFLTICFLLVIPSSVNAQSCGSVIKLGAGDTTKPSDTRFASQWCRGKRSTADSISVRGFVPGSGDRIFNNSLTPCERIRGAALYCGSNKVSQASVRPGCANGRLTFDFCSPRGGGATTSHNLVCRRCVNELCQATRPFVSSRYRPALNRRQLFVGFPEHL